ncbi:MAG: TadA family conjugal transfer-associated ATPase [Bifidobacteriaceae bacterium]|jgi:pilus assembly protein CpaF|nr:TadA family conjugal transfer-associated ATPase [Bifidobacteriaceae bacterium]
MLTQVDKVIDSTRNTLISDDKITSKKDIFDKINQNNIIGSSRVDKMVDAVSADLLGLGPLQFLAEIKGVTDIVVNGPNNVFIDRGHGMERAQIEPEKLDTSEKLREFAFKLAVLSGSRLDDSAPIVDAQLPMGYRLHAVIEPLCENGALISIRIPSQNILSFDQFVADKTINQQWAENIKQFIKERKNIVITGATGSGKTTLLAALISLINQSERIICIEESKEIPNFIHPHIISLIAKKPNIEGLGEITLQQLVKASLRMRPDRLLLGEARGPEISDLLIALNTGHKGGIATLHSNDANSVPARLEALGALAGLKPQALAAQAISAIDIILHIDKISCGKFDSSKNLVKRKLTQIAKLTLNTDYRLGVEILQSEK